MLRTVIYLRKSTQDKDEKQIHSLPRQRSELLDYIEKYNSIASIEEKLIFDENKDIYNEDASAKYPGRVVFNKMVETIKKNKYDVLLCFDLSRLSRNAIDNGVVVQLLEDKKLKKIQTKDKYFTATPTDKFTLGLFLSVSKFENDQRALNTASGMNFKKNQGGTTNKAPMGYINIGEHKGEKGIAEDGDNFDKLKNIWEMMISGNYSVAELAKEGAKMGITLIRNKKQNTREIAGEGAYRGMFQNPYYYGVIDKLNKNTGEIIYVKGKHPAMVTQDIFEQVQLLLQKNSYKHQKPRGEANMDKILNEILICGKCNTRMIFEKSVRYTCSNCGHRYKSASKNPCAKCHTAINSKTKIQINRYFRCGNKVTNKICYHNTAEQSVKYIQAEKIENFLQQELSKIYISDNLFQILKKQLYTLWLDKNKNINNQIDDLNKKYKKLRDNRLKLTNKKFTEDEELNNTEKEDLEHSLLENKIQQEDIDEQIKDLNPSSTRLNHENINFVQFSKNKRLIYGFCFFRK